jgi:hypothetical protein
MQYPMIAQPQYAFAPTMMAEGGLVPAAKAVQSQGRNNDTMLVHMTPNEVGGLQALAMAHGGSLSINPQTGLPEAGFLENILPTLLGVGLSFIPGVGPMAAGMITGGIETVRTGDLGKGLLAGLGAYGGANLAGSLGAAGAQQGVQAAGVAGQDLMNQTVLNTPGLAETGAQLAPTNLPTQTMGDLYRTAGAQDALLMRNAQTLPASVQALPTPTGVPPTFMQNAAQAGQGVKNLFASGQTGEAARTAAMGNLGGPMGAAKTAGSVISPMLTPEPYKLPKGEKSTYEGPYVPTPRDVRFPTAEERQGLGTSEFQYFSNVNPVPGFQPFSATTPTTSGLSAPVATPMMTEEELRRIASLSTPMQMKDGGVPMLEDGGFVLTKKAVDGLGKGDNKRGQKVASRGLGAIPIKGPGTGTSDSIKTSIEGKRPALVSNGEAYVPKKQVTKHGGAKKFYALMKKAERAAA